MSQNKSFRRKILVILGMHRSGTSALTKSLETLGFNLGTELFKAREDNPKGFWEDKDCVAINDRLLKYCGSSWSDLSLESIDSLPQKQIQLVLEQAKALLSQRLDEYPLWGFKDPRTCRLLPFWKLVFDSLNLEPLYLISIRNPLNVAASLLKRDRFSIITSLYLWEQHNLSAISETRGASRLVVDYDLLLDDPKKQIARISKAFNISAPGTHADKLIDYCDQFLDSKLRHGISSLADLNESEHVRHETFCLYELLTKVANDNLSLESKEFENDFEKLLKAFSHQKTTLPQISLLEKERLSYLSQTIDLQSSIITAEKEAAEKASEAKTELALIQESLAKKEADLSQLSKILEDTSKFAQEQTRLAQSEAKLKVTATQSLNLLMEAHEEQKRKFENKSADLANTIKLTSQQISEKNNLIEKLNLQIVELRNQLETREQEFKNKSADLENTIKLTNQQISEKNNLIEKLNLQRVELRNQLETCELDLNKLQQEILELQNSQDAKENEIAQSQVTITSQAQKIVEFQSSIELLEKKNTTLTQDLESRITYLEQLATDRQNTINTILSSKSWKLTKCLRDAIRLKSKINQARKTPLRRLALQSWQKAPISRERKDQIRNALFKRLPYIFKNTARYNHWLEENKETIVTRIAQPSQSVLVSDNFTPYEEKINKTPLHTRLIAFYLPQFHAIPENDKWWGQGFTEWTNVKPSQPLFSGHYQPHVPLDLGYYDLLDGKTQRKQVELAKNYGIGGFCFYMYWFAGKRLLEKPLDNYLKDPSLDLPFCVCWANENWSRRWDGLDNDILISQRHSPEDDIAFIKEASIYLNDPRYIRVDGKPLLVIYRPSLFPNIIETTQRWRNWCRESGLGEIHLAYTQSFESKDPISYGFDSAIEFPPNNACPPNLTNEVKKSNAGFQGTAYDWRHYSKKSESYSEHGYSLFRSVCPAWDNTARRKDRGTLFLNSAPSGYQTWLENAIVHTRQTRIKSQSERIVFINAWNEWAEGAHLEPDQKYGYAYLEATHNALVNTATTSNSKAIVLITHDCHKHGAQFQTLETARVFKSMGYQVFTLSLGGGDLFSDFAAISQIINIRNCDANQVDSFLNQAKRAGATVAISSTVVAGSILPKLKEFQFKIISLIHELPGIIKSLKQENNAKNVVEYADKIVFPAKLVSDKFSEIAPTPDSKVIIRPQGLLRRNIFKGQRQFAREQVLDKYKLSPDSKIILTVGYGDDRKGVDQLARLAKATLQHQPKSVFIWVGSIEARLLSALKKEIEDSDLSNQIILADFQPDPSIFYAAADAYALTSLEDPFPNVVNEAIDMDVPVVAYQGATGAADYITANRGKLSRWMDIDDFAINLSAVLQQKREPLPCKGGSLRQYILDLMFYIDNQHRLSVVVPNYNYAKYLPERIRSIAVQDYPIYELIILDDHSSDNSLEVIHELANNLDFDTLVVANETNSGSVFKQWSTGAALARGDLLWIAEADDLSEPEFLNSLVSRFNDGELVLAYSESKQIDSSGKVLANDYLNYTLKASPCFRRDYHRHGTQEIIKALAVKNTIPNVSGVVFKLNALSEVLENLKEILPQMKVAGDWLIYLHILTKGNISFCSRSLNKHRRHNGSVTSSLQKQRHLKEVIEMQLVADQMVILPESTRSIAIQYIEELRHFFGLTEHHLPAQSNG